MPGSINRLTFCSPVNIIRFAPLRRATEIPAIGECTYQEHHPHFANEQTLLPGGGEGEDEVDVE